VLSRDGGPRFLKGELDAVTPDMARRMIDEFGPDFSYDLPCSSITGSHIRKMVIDSLALPMSRRVVVLRTGLAIQTVALSCRVARGSRFVLGVMVNAGAVCFET
jgi:hypothetical protein